MAVAATTVKKPSENSPIKRARRRRCERKQTPQNRVIATKERNWEKTVEDACLLQKEAVQASYVAVCLLKLLEDHKDDGLEGTPTHLLKEVKRVALEAGVDEKSLPRNAVWFSRRLKEICKNLRAYGWEVSEDRGDDRRVSITPSQDPKNTDSTDGNHDSKPPNGHINHADTANYRGGQVPDSNDSIFPHSTHKQVVADGETEALVAEPASGHQDGDTIVEEL